MTVVNGFVRLVAGMRRIAAFVFLALSGCSYARPVVINQIALGPKEHPIAIVAGEATASSFLGFGLEGEDTLVSAINDAKKKAGVTDGTLYNVFVDERLFCFPSCWFPLYHVRTLSVYGTLVTYDDPLFHKTTSPDQKQPSAGNPQLF